MPQSSTTEPGSSLLENQMNREQTVTNPQNQRTCHIDGGPASTAGAVYAAECTKHKKMYIGQTKRKLNLRFNNHRSDADKHPEHCKLAEHFHENDCNMMSSDLRVSVLEQVSGSSALREYKEDKWITRLQTQEPTGLNATFKTDFGPIYNKLFS